MLLKYVRFLTNTNITNRQRKRAAGSLPWQWLTGGVEGQGHRGCLFTAQWSALSWETPGARGGLSNVFIFLSLDFKRGLKGNQDSRDSVYKHKHELNHISSVINMRITFSLGPKILIFLKLLKVNVASLQVSQEAATASVKQVKDLQKLKLYPLSIQ